MELEGYDILSQLSRGGTGKVYLARRRGVHGFEKLVAIKTIAGPADDEALRVAFLDEARLLARLVHPAIAQTFDVGDVDGVPYLVMEYVAGAPLHEAMSGPWPPVAAAHEDPRPVRRPVPRWGTNARVAHARDDPGGGRRDNARH